MHFYPSLKFVGCKSEIGCHFTFNPGKSAIENPSTLTNSKYFVQFLSLSKPEVASVGDYIQAKAIFSYLLKFHLKNNLSIPSL